MNKLNLCMLAGTFLLYLTAKPMMGPGRQLIFWDLPPLHKAAHDGNIEQIRALIPTNNINGLDDGGCAPLHYAIRQNNLPMIRELLACGANLNQSQRNGVTVAEVASLFPNINRYIVHVAPRIPGFLQNCQAGNLDAVQAELQWRTPDGHHGIDVNATRDGFSSPLHYAVRHAGNNEQSPWIDVARTLIARHALVNVQDQDGNSPISYAILNSNAVLARYLITHQANPVLDNTTNICSEFLQTQVFNSLPH